MPDPAGNPLGDANVIPYLNGKAIIMTPHGAESQNPHASGRNGLFMLEIPLSSDKVKDGKWALKVTRPSFRPSQMIPLTGIAEQGKDEKGVRQFVASATVSLKRIQGTAFWIALTVFVMVYVLIAFLKDKYRITDPRLLAVGGSVLLGVILLFILHGFFHMEVSVAALFGAALMVLVNKMDIVEILEREIEWPSLVFFIMLFIVVGAAEQTGILQVVADWILRVCHGNLVVAVLIILWVSGITSAIVDNIPFTATMLPIVAFLGKTIPGAESGVLWWALALGACFGGNGTIIGASANVVTTGIAERAGHKITFFEFFKQGAPITIVSLIIASIFLLIRYCQRWFREGSIAWDTRRRCRARGDRRIAVRSPAPPYLISGVPSRIIRLPIGL